MTRQTSRVVQDAIDAAWSVAYAGLCQRHCKADCIHYQALENLFRRLKAIGGPPQDNYVPGHTWAEGVNGERVCAHCGVKLEVASSSCFANEEWNLPLM